MRNRRSDRKEESFAEKEIWVQVQVPGSGTSGFRFRVQGNPGSGGRASLVIVIILRSSILVSPREPHVSLFPSLNFRIWLRKEISN